MSERRTSSLFEGLNGEEKLRLGSWLETASLEILPDRKVAERLIELAPGRKVNVTSSPSLGIESTLEISHLLTEAGVSVTPHIAARSIIDLNHTQHIFEKLKEMKITEIFAVGGDNKNPIGKFYKTIQFLDVAHLLGASLKRVFVAGYPQGHHAISQITLLESLKQKQEWAGETKTNMSILTQICFSPADTVRWIEKIRGEGIKLPIVLGVTSPIKLSTLRDFVVSFGVQDLALFLRNKTLDTMRIGGLAMERYEPGELLAELAKKIKPEHNVAGIHFFTFNAVKATRDWIDSARSQLK